MFSSHVFSAKITAHEPEIIAVFTVIFLKNLDYVWMKFWKFLFFRASAMANFRPFLWYTLFTKKINFKYNIYRLETENKTTPFKKYTWEKYAEFYRFWLACGPWRNILLRSKKGAQSKWLSSSDLLRMRNFPHQK